MSETENDRAVIGGNNPPEDPRAEKYAAIMKDVDDLAKKGTDLPVEVDSEETAEKYLEVIKLARKKATQIDKTDRMDANRPLQDEIDGNNVFFRALSSRLVRMEDVLTRRVEGFHARRREAERKRLADEAAERQRLADEERKRTEEAIQVGGVEAELAEDRQARLDAEAQAAEHKVFKDTGPARFTGGTVGTKKGLDFRVKDYSALDLNELRGSFNVDAIDKAIRDHIRRHKGKSPLKGVEIFETSKLNIR